MPAPALQAAWPIRRGQSSGQGQRQERDAGQAPELAPGQGSPAKATELEPEQAPATEQAPALAVVPARAVAPARAVVPGLAPAEGLAPARDLAVAPELVPGLAS